MRKSKRITSFSHPKEPHEYISGYRKRPGKPELKKNFCSVGVFTMIQVRSSYRTLEQMSEG